MKSSLIQSFQVFPADLCFLFFFFCLQKVKAYLPGRNVDSISDEASEKVVILLNCPWSTKFEEAIAKQS